VREKRVNTYVIPRGRGWTTGDDLDAAGAEQAHA
jgi:hypothetical protein